MSGVAPTFKSADVLNVPEESLTKILLVDADTIIAVQDGVPELPWYIVAPAT